LHIFNASSKLISPGFLIINIPLSLSWYIS
jgi:hypothetical protein